MPTGSEQEFLMGGYAEVSRRYRNDAHNDANRKPVEWTSDRVENYFEALRKRASGKLKAEHWPTSYRAHTGMHVMSEICLTF